MAEVIALDLDWDLIQHLAVPASFYKLQTEQFTELLIEDELARKVYLWQLDHTRNHSEPASASVIEEEFDDVAISEPETAIGDLIERLRKRFVRNSGQVVVDNIAELTIKDPLNVGREMVSQGRRMINITQMRGESYGPEDHDRAITEYDAEMTKGVGPSYGFSEIDQHFHGQRGISFLLAAPKNYKSWLTIKSVLTNARTGGFPYLYSLELPADDTYWRLKCMAADIPYWRYLHGALEPGDFDQLETTAETLRSVGQFRVEKPQPGERRVPQLMEKALNAGASCVFIDQLQYVESSKGEPLGALNKTGDYFEVCNDFRDYSDRVPIFIVHQFNRTVMGIDGMPEMQQAKGSSAIEEVGTMALAAWANKDMRASNLLNVGVLFSRHYGHATWEVGVELSRACDFTLNGIADE